MIVHQHISADPAVMTGKPCIKGTRITVANIVRQVAAGRTVAEICEDYPDLKPQSVQAALEFAAELASADTYELAS